MKYGFAGLALLLMPVAAHADPRDETLSAVLRCSGMTDKAQRLACYDSAAVRVPGALNAPPPPVAAASTPPPRARSGGFIAGIFGPGVPSRNPQTSSAQFGIESIAEGGKRAEPGPINGDTLDEITAHLVSYDVRNGVMTVILDNGQSWRQIAGPPVGHLARPAASYVVTVARGSAGSYVMKLNGFARTLAVRRLR